MNNNLAFRDYHFTKLLQGIFQAEQKKYLGNNLVVILTIWKPKIVMKLN